MSGGSQSFLWNLANIQIEQNHEVTIICCKQSHFPFPIRTIDHLFQEGYIQSKNARAFEKNDEDHFFYPLLNYLHNNKEKFDIIHNHSFDRALFVNLQWPSFPILHTLHLPPIYPLINEVLRPIPHQPHSLISISKTMQNTYLKAGIRTHCISNGTRLQPLGCGGCDLLWSGRICPEKNLELALKFCKSLKKVRLQVTGVIEDIAYFQALKASYSFDYLGWLDYQQQQTLLGQIRALLFTPSWNEPFGLIIIESMMRGTPVITLRKGVLEELVQENVSGFFISDRLSFENAYQKSLNFDRKGCRQYAIDHFLLDRTSMNYQKYYQKLVALSTS